MGFNDNQWEINRAPTKSERIISIIAALIASAILGFFSIGSIMMHYDKGVESIAQNDVIFLLIVTLLLFITLRILYRAIFSVARKPSPFTVLLTAYSVGIMSCGLLIAGLLIDTDDLSRKYNSILIGFIGVAWSIHAIRGRARAGNDS